jgi:glycosyltransferase involved in cell wall biosynthesis
VRYPQIPGLLGLATAGGFLYKRLASELSRLHRDHPVDVIHAHGALPCGQAAARLADRLKVPFVLTIHGLDVFNSGHKSGVAAEWRRRASVATYEAARSVVCVSGKVQSLVRAGAPAGISSSVIYNGVDTDLFSPASSGGLSEDEILAIGNLIPTKGHELLLRAIARMAATRPQVQCRIIGEGPELPRLLVLARDLGIGEKVHFLGRQSRVAVAEAMCRCTVFALPSRSEGLGCVYLEAMACAKPVVACRGQGIEEIIEHERNGWLISPEQPDELVDALTTLLNRPEAASRIGSVARQTVLNGLSLAHQAEQLAAVYREARSLASSPAL